MNAPAKEIVGQPPVMSPRVPGFIVLHTADEKRRCYVRIAGIQRFGAGHVVGSAIRLSDIWAYVEETPEQIAALIRADAEARP